MFEKAGVGNGQHHGAGGGLLALQRRQGQLAGVADEQFFKGHPGPKAQRAASQAADGPGGEFEEPGALAVDTKFGVYGTVAETQSMGCLFGTADDLGLQFLAETGRGDIECFFKEGTVQRVGLVKQGQRLQTARGQQPFQGNLSAGDETFDEDAFIRFIPFLAYVRSFQQGAQPPESRDELGRGIGAHDAPACRQGERFYDARVRNLVLHEMGDRSASGNT